MLGYRVYAYLIGLNICRMLLRKADSVPPLSSSAQSYSGPHSCRYFALSSFLISAGLAEVNLTVVSICIFLGTSEFEHLFKCFKTRVNYSIYFISFVL